MNHHVLNTKLLAQALLMNPLDREWTLQGLGMLRTYLTPDRSVRLHVWDSRYAVPDVSEMHTHPWDMVSTVVAGELKNYKYRHNLSLTVEPTYLQQAIHCGEGGGLIGEPEPVALFEQLPVYLSEGQSYSQSFNEIHVSVPKDGTVTIVQRQVPPGGSPDRAYVFWPDGQEWVSAEPRPADPSEVEDICERSLLRWFS